MATTTTSIIMTRATTARAVLAGRATSLLLYSGQRCYLSSSSFPKGVGVIKPRKQQAVTGEPAAPVSNSGVDSSLSSSSVVEEIPFSVKRNNFLLASALFTFCGGVAWYSMNAVGQADASAGSSSRGGENTSNDAANDVDDDPLAALRLEAQAAQKARDKQQEEAKEASAMLQQFDKGAFDPDRIEEEELLAEEDENNKKKQGKSWWRWLKFW